MVPQLADACKYTVVQGMCMKEDQGYLVLAFLSSVALVLLFILPLSLCHVAHLIVAKRRILNRRTHTQKKKEPG